MTASPGCACLRGSCCCQFCCRMYPFRASCSLVWTLLTNPICWCSHQHINIPCLFDCFLLLLGLLEDVSLQGQLFISRIFDTLRRLLSKLTFSAVPATPSSAALAARQRQGWGMHRFGSTSSSTSMGSTPGHASTATQPGSPGIWDRLRHPMAFSGGHAAAGAGAARASGSTAGAAASPGGRLKLRSVTSVDLPVSSGTTYACMHASAVHACNTL